jgi:hypothetical protein
MNISENSFCFCTLALGERYRFMVKELANDLKQYSSGTKLIVGTEKPNDFDSKQNIIAFKLHQQGVLHCYNDKRFVLEKALLNFKTAIYIDADTRIVETIPNNLEFPAGLVGCHKNMLEHISKYRPQDLEKLKQMSLKLNIQFEQAQWIGESLFILTKDGGKEQDFLQIWSKLATYSELRGMYSGEGSIMGLAAAKVGWQINKSESWDSLKQMSQHLDASRQRSKQAFWNYFQSKLAYHYRLNKMRLFALKDFSFYYLQ